MSLQVCMAWLLIALAGCSQRSYPVVSTARNSGPKQPGTSADAQPPGRAVSEPSASSADQFGVKVIAIRLTAQYTILDLRFTNRGQKLRDKRGRYVPIGFIWIDPKTRLTTANGTRAYAFIKADGIAVLPRRVRVDPFDQVSFSLYFERLDKGIETFDCGHCAGKSFCWDLPGLHVTNPADAGSSAPPVSLSATTSALAGAESMRVGDKLTLHNLYFDVAKADLLPASFAELDQLAALMQSHPQLTIRIEGHTDAIGDHQKNLQLSQDRAGACRRYLVQKGIAGNRIQTVGYGDTRPVSLESTDDARKTNRRVEFVILSL